MRGAEAQLGRTGQPFCGVTDRQQRRARVEQTQTVALVGDDVGVERRTQGLRQLGHELHQLGLASAVQTAGVARSRGRREDLSPRGDRGQPQRA
ncbi:MAG: hypothetical protein IPG96_04880 [Proteobacteria bacterium]|nr:hypothetical protein [Pseudomonadota bacterium]